MNQQPVNQQVSLAPAINPYAPSDATGAKPNPAMTSGVQGGDVAGKTILFVSLSGGIFGGLLGCTFGTAALFRTAGSVTAVDTVGGFLACLVIGGVIGMVAAFLASLPVVVMLCVIFGGANVGRSKFWAGSRVRTFGGLSGFFTGWSTIAVLSVIDMEVYGLVVGLVPGAAVAIATMLMLGRMAKRADEAIANAEIESVGKDIAADPLTT